jgi:hypothetical protein
MRSFLCLVLHMIACFLKLFCIFFVLPWNCSYLDTITLNVYLKVHMHTWFVFFFLGEFFFCTFPESTIHWLTEAIDTSIHGFCSKLNEVIKGCKIISCCSRNTCSINYYLYAIDELIGYEKSKIIIIYLFLLLCSFFLGIQNNKFLCCSKSEFSICLFQWTQSCHVSLLRVENYAIFTLRIAFGYYQKSMLLGAPSPTMFHPVFFLLCVSNLISGNRVLSISSLAFIAHHYHAP